MIRIPWPIFIDVSNWFRFEVENMQAGDELTTCYVRVLETQLPAELAP
jgi:hypothetical protein